MTQVPQVDITEIAHRNDMTVEQVQEILNQAISSMTTLMRRIDVIDNSTAHWYSVERKGVGIIETPFGEFWEYYFEINDQWRRYNVIVKANTLDDMLNPAFQNTERLVLRIDSGCETGQLFGDMTCECHEQLLLAMKTLADIGEGMIINIPQQDGRGMTLGFKLSTLLLQKKLNLNTVESASMLAPGGIIDVRTYAGIIAIMKFFGIPTTCDINLASNNPKKALVFAENGYRVTDRVPIIIPPTEYTRHHLAAKQEFLGHEGLISHGSGQQS
jgi:3,4-dihydroxy 2-butanone 4-phosphate synthase / GTP cyclohydrolase II